MDCLTHDYNLEGQWESIVFGIGKEIQNDHDQ